MKKSLLLLSILFFGCPEEPEENEEGSTEKNFYLSRNHNCYNGGALSAYYNGTIAAFGSADLFFIIYQ